MLLIWLSFSACVFFVLVLVFVFEFGFVLLFFCFCYSFRFHFATAKMIVQILHTQSLTRRMAKVDREMGNAKWKKGQLRAFRCVTEWVAVELISISFNFKYSHWLSDFMSTYNMTGEANLILKLNRIRNLKWVSQRNPEERNKWEIIQIVSSC